MSLRIEPCYDGGRHRWRARNRLTMEPSRSQNPAPYQQWCERCGKWKSDIQYVAVMGAV